MKALKNVPTEGKLLSLMKIIANIPNLSLHKLKRLYSEDKDVQSLHTNLSQCSSAYKEKVRLRIFSMFK